jgi:hypothetical protein
MAITAITISQDNIINGSNLMPVQSSLTFIADVDYTGATPDSVDIEILDESDVVLETYAAVPYKDVTTTQRQFVFKAEGPLKALIDDFEDFFQLNETLEYVENITRQFKIKFLDPDTPATNDEVLIDGAQAVRQFGDYPNLEDQFNNDTDTYYAPKDSWVYVYFYNDDITNDVAIDGPALTEGNALDFDDAIFTDFDDENFTIFTIV